MKNLIPSLKVLQDFTDSFLLIRFYGSLMYQIYFCQRTTAGVPLIETKMSNVHTYYEEQNLLKA